MATSRDVAIVRGCTLNDQVSRNDSAGRAQGRAAVLGSRKLHIVHHVVKWLSDSANLIALASIVVACAAAVYARSSAQSAKRAYNLALEQNARRDPRLTLYQSDALSLNSLGSVKVAISVTIANPTDIDNSVARAELAVSYHRSDGRTTVINIPAATDSAELLPGVSDIFCHTINVPSHQVVAGWFVFELPKMILHDCTIDSYSLSVEDSHQRSTALPNLLVRESFASGGIAHSDVQEEESTTNNRTPG